MEFKNAYYIILELNTHMYHICMCVFKLYDYLGRIICLPADTLALKVQNLQWTPDFFGAVTLTWSRPKNLPQDSCSFIIYYRWVLI